MSWNRSVVARFGILTTLSALAALGALAPSWLRPVAPRMAADTTVAPEPNQAFAPVKVATSSPTLAMWLAQQAVLAQSECDNAYLTATTGQVFIHSNFSDDTADDDGLDMATNGQNRWVAVWSTIDPVSGSGPDADVFAVFSNDDGTTWNTTPIVISTGELGIRADVAPAITFSQNRFICVWESFAVGASGQEGNAEIRYATSLNGTTWTLGTAPLSDPAAFNARAPHIDADGGGTVIAAWHATTGGGDNDIYYNLSFNDGATWLSDELPLNNNAAIDLVQDRNVRIEAGEPLGIAGANVWVAVWESGTNSSDWDILSATSIDDGVTFLAPVLVNDGQNDEAGENEFRPDIASNLSGGWVVVWESNAADGNADSLDFDIQSAFSQQPETSWETPILVNTDAEADANDDRNPQADTNLNGVWVVAWDTPNRIPGSRRGPIDSNNNRDIHAAISTDNAGCWSDPRVVNPRAASQPNGALFDDIDPVVKVSRRENPILGGTGRWLVGWATNENLLGADNDFDLVSLAFRSAAGNDGSEGEGEGEGSLEGEGEGTTEGTTEGTDQQAADFSAITLIRDREALVPLMDWMPLMNFTMGFDPENPEPRLLEQLIFSLIPDTRAEPPYAIGSQPEVDDILEFGLFQERRSSEGAKDQLLDTDNDFLLFTWDSTGRIVSPGGPQVRLDADGFKLQYQLNFAANGAPITNPPVEAGPADEFSPGEAGNSYIIAMRTSATFRTTITTRLRSTFARMVRPGTGEFPTDDEGAPSDSYSPNFYENEFLEDEAAYSASFNVWNITKGGVGTNRSLFVYNNYLDDPGTYYSPAEPFFRPTYGALQNLISFVGAGTINIRQLVPFDAWKEMIGIDLHSSSSLHFESVNRATPRRAAEEIQEVNIVLTDVGGDPFGPPGNGGFDPRDMLERLTTRFGQFEAVTGNDVTFNGVQVWHDANQDGVFTPPQTGLGIGTGDGGRAANVIISNGADAPMLLSDFGSWEYVPFPPGGGDPWWKIRLFLSDGERRPFGEFSNGANTDGYLTPVPDNVVGTSYPLGSADTIDYFVVVRTDSGFNDVSGLVGDGSGIAAGSDFAAFIEPRRFNPLTGGEDGGIYVSSMIPGVDNWQDDGRWLTTEPWWNQRTSDQTTALPVRVGLEVYDLAILHNSDSIYSVQTDYVLGGSGPIARNTTGLPVMISGYADNPGVSTQFPTDYSRWLDPFGLRQIQFANLHTPGAYRETLELSVTLPYFDIFGGNFGSFTIRGEGSIPYFPYETTPFRSSADFPPSGPRSELYPNPLQPRTTPDISTWPPALEPGAFPQEDQWPASEHTARLLTQKMDPNGLHTAILGLNVVASNDPVVNQFFPPRLARVDVAFWGPDFKPEHLRPLDPQGSSLNSGVLLWLDDGDGSFLGAPFEGVITGAPILVDQILPLQNLRWRSAPELVDVDGDGLPDDMDGNNVVDQRDKCWVLSLSINEQNQQLFIPQNDISFFVFAPSVIVGGTAIFNFDQDRFLSTTTLPFMTASANFLAAHAVNAVVENTIKKVEAKQVGPTPPAVTAPLTDLFVSVRTSENVPRFAPIRAVVPASLPERNESLRRSGVQFFPNYESAADSFIKRNPEEQPVADFWGHDTLITNVASKITSIIPGNGTVYPGSATLPVLGVDVSTNLPQNTLASGSAGAGGIEGLFTVPTATWSPNAFVGDYLVDSTYRSFRITANTNKQLTLEGGTPADGIWRIERDPTFLEQIIVEFYQEGNDNAFNPVFDLLPLDRDQFLSGVALFRDNDADPRNRNGQFDPGIDLPVTLDDPPFFTGQPGEFDQVKFVFSQPGTDNLSTPEGPVAQADQPIHRQWVPNTFGSGQFADPNTGPEFFVVVRPSSTIAIGDDFRAGIVSWGINTPSEPDPDTFSYTDLGSAPGQRDDFVKFEEFPWGSRALGFITLLKEPQKRYYMIGGDARVTEDQSGIPFIRSRSNAKTRTNVITAVRRPIGPRTLVIDDASPRVLPQQLPNQTFNVVITGQGFGDAPVVAISDYNVRVVRATDTKLDIELTNIPNVVPEEPIVVRIANPLTRNEDTRTDLFTLGEGQDGETPSILNVSPSRGDRTAFPVTISGARFDATEGVRVFFENTELPVISTTRTAIVVGFPQSSFAKVGPLDITVRNNGSGREDTAVDAFTFVADVDDKQDARAGCAGAGVPGSGHGLGGDATVVMAVIAALAVATLRRRAAAA